MNASVRGSMRAASPDDAAQTVPLLVEAIDHLALQLAGADEHAAAWPFFTHLFRTSGHRYSHAFVRVLEIDGDVAGAILAYAGADEARLMAPVLAEVRARVAAAAPVFEPESRVDEFYIDALAVAPHHRGAGYAGQLIADICRHAATAGHACVGLLVDIDKPGVERLYRRLGFTIDGERSLAGHRYHHMSRPAA